MKAAITLFIVLLACNIAQTQMLPKVSPILQPIESILNSSADCFQGTVTNKVN